MANLPITNSTELSLIEETVEGTTPATPAFSSLRFRGETINETLNSETDEEIRSDRNYTDSLLVSGESSGDINFNFYYGPQTDIFLMAVLQTSAPTWSTTESIYNEKTKRYYTIEKKLVDSAGADIFFRYTGMQASTLTLNFADGILQGSVSWMGLDAVSDTVIITGATYSPVDVAPLMNSADSVTAIAIKDSGDSDIGAVVQDMTLTLDNGLRGQRALGNLYNAGIASSRFKAEVSGNLYFKDRTIYDNFKLNALMKLDMTLTDSNGASYQFVMNNLKTTSYEVTAGGVDQDMIVAWSAMAFAEGSPARSITITKTDA